MAKRSNNRGRQRSSGLRLLLLLVLMALLAASLWFGYVYREIVAVAAVDRAEAADAIAVFGAAQYRGHPSPVFHARLDHAAALFNRKMAPLIITLGGTTDRSAATTEGSVGRNYLLAQGVPYQQIIAETESVDTEQQAEQLAAIAHTMHLKRLIVVSDATHLFRVQALCHDQGLTVYTSPRAPFGNISSDDAAIRISHEMLSYTALRLHLNVSWLHRWLAGKEEL